MKALVLPGSSPMDDEDHEEGMALHDDEDRDEAIMDLNLEEGEPEEEEEEGADDAVHVFQGHHGEALV